MPPELRLDPIPEESVLCLFDIDGTLVDTGGAGLCALEETTRHFFGGDGPPFDLAGSTDLGIMEGLFAHFGEQMCLQKTADFFDHYHGRLDWNLACGRFPGKILPGVTALLDSLSAMPHITVGLLTGNTEQGAAVKTRHYGLDHHFRFGAYGSDHADRNLLGPVALERAAALHDRDFSASDTWVIGDTPKDIACARAMGARCLAVATGRFSTHELCAYGPDITVESDLTNALRHWV